MSETDATGLDGRPSPVWSSRTDSMVSIGDIAATPWGVRAVHARIADLYAQGHRDAAAAIEAELHNSGDRSPGREPGN